MAVSYASLVTDNVDYSIRLNLPKLQPYTLQELCRFAIRKSIRQSIESQDENYYKIKRELSTFNPNRESKQPERRSSDSGSEEAEQDDEMFQNFERVFSARLRSGNNIDNQLRMMIYGHLMDTNSRLSVHLGGDETEDAQNRALVLVRPNEGRNEEGEDNEASPRETGDSGLSDGSQSSSLTESSQASLDQQQSKKARKDSLSEERKENLLRMRILQLPLPINVKSFVLYYRGI